MTKNLLRGERSEAIDELSDNEENNEEAYTVSESEEDAEDEVSEPPMEADVREGSEVIGIFLDSNVRWMLNVLAETTSKTTEVVLCKNDRKNEQSPFLRLVRVTIKRPQNELKF